MSTVPTSPNNRTPAPGLPPVTPPTARFVVQLFLVPALIVAFLIVVAMSFQFFFGLLFGTPSAEHFLKKLDDPNAEVRWRAAADLAQVLLRPHNGLSSDADFGLKLAHRLQKAHANNKDAEKAFAERLPTLSHDDAERERKKLEGERNYIQYLSACLGNFLMPIGVPVLQELATQETDMEPKALYDQRCWAVWALAVVGESCKSFDKLSAVEQANILAQLEAASERRDHADWATTTRDYLQARQSGQPTTMGVEETLEKCAAAPYPYLRELTALACNSWSGTTEESKRIEAALEKLSYDKGDGEEEQRQLVGDNPDGTSTVTSKPGRQVCYNATIALARRGSDKTRVGLLEEMLDNEQLHDLFKLRQKDGQEQPDEGLIATTENNALKAVAELSRHKPNLVTPSLREAVEKLTTHPNSAIAQEAKQTKLALGS